MSGKKNNNNKKPGNFINYSKKSKTCPTRPQSPTPYYKNQYILTGFNIIHVTAMIEFANDSHRQNFIKARVFGNMSAFRLNA